MRLVTAVLITGGDKLDRNRIYRHCICIWQDVAGSLDGR